MTEREEEIASTMPADLDALPRLRGFRLRGMEMTRLETFIDAALRLRDLIHSLSFIHRLPAAV